MDIAKAITRITGDSSRALRRSYIKKVKDAADAAGAEDAADATGAEDAALDTIGPKSITKIAGDKARALRQSSIQNIKNAVGAAMDTIGPRRPVVTDSQTQILDTIDSDNISTASRTRSVANNRTSKTESSPVTSKTSFTKETEQNAGRMSTTSTKRHSMDNGNIDTDNHPITSKTSFTLDTETSDRNLGNTERDSRGSSKTSKTRDLADTERDSRGSSKTSKSRDFVDTERDSRGSSKTSKSRDLADTERDSRGSPKTSKSRDLADTKRDSRGSSKTSKSRDLADTERDSRGSSKTSKSRDLADTERDSRGSPKTSQTRDLADTEGDSRGSSKTSKTRDLADTERDSRGSSKTSRSRDLVDTERDSRGSPKTSKTRDLAYTERDSRGSSKTSKTRDLADTERDSRGSSKTSKTMDLVDTERDSRGSPKTSKTSLLADTERDSRGSSKTSKIMDFADTERNYRGSSKTSNSRDLSYTERGSNISPITSKNRSVTRNNDIEPATPKPGSVFDTERNSKKSSVMSGNERNTRERSNMASAKSSTSNQSEQTYPVSDKWNSSDHIMEPIARVASGAKDSTITNVRSQPLSQPMPPASPTTNDLPPPSRIEPDMLINMLMSLPPMIMPVPGPLLDSQPQQGRQGRRQSPPPLPLPPTLLLPVFPMSQFPHYPPVPYPLPQNNILRSQYPTRSFPEQLIPCANNTGEFSSRPDYLDYNDERTDDPTTRRSCNTKSLRKAIKRRNNSPSNDKCSQKKKKDACDEKNICRRLIKMMLQQEISKKYKKDLGCCLCPKHLGACFPPTMCVAEPASHVTQTRGHDCCQEPQTSQCGSPSKEYIQRRDSKAVGCQCTDQSGQAKKMKCSTIGKLANSLEHVPVNVNRKRHCVHSSSYIAVDEKEKKTKKLQTEKCKTIQFIISKKNNRSERKPLCLNFDINQLCRLVSCEAEGNTLLWKDGGEGGQLSNECLPVQLCGRQKDSFDLTNIIVPNKKQCGECKDEQLTMGTVPRKDHKWTHTKDRDKNSKNCHCQCQDQQRTGADQNVTREREESSGSRRTLPWSWSDLERDRVATKKYNLDKFKSTILGSSLRSNTFNDVGSKSKPSFDKRCGRDIELSSDAKFKCEDIKNPLTRTGIMSKTLHRLKERYEKPCSISKQSPDFTNMTKRLRMINNNIESTKNKIKNSLYCIIENRKGTQLSPTSLQEAKRTRNERFKIGNEDYDPIWQKEQDILRTERIPRCQISTLQFIESRVKTDIKKQHCQSRNTYYNRCRNNSRDSNDNEENTTSEGKEYIMCRQTSKVSKHLDGFLDKNESRFTSVLSINRHEDQTTEYLDSGGETSLNLDRIIQCFSTQLDLSDPLVDKISKNRLSASTYRECNFVPDDSPTSSTYFEQDVHELNTEGNELTADSIYEKGFCESDDHRIITESLTVKNPNRHNNEKAYKNKDQSPAIKIPCSSKTDLAKKCKEQKRVSGKNTKEMGKEKEISPTRLPSLPLISDSDTLCSDGYLTESKCNTRHSDEHIDNQLAPGNATPSHTNQLLETDSDISINMFKENYHSARLKPTNAPSAPRNDQSQITNCNSVTARDTSYKYPCVICDRYCPENKCSRISNCSITTTNSKVSFSKESVKSKESYSVQNDHSSGSHESNSCHDSSLSSDRASFSTDNPKQTLTQMKCKKSRNKSDNPCQNPCGKSFKKCKVQFDKSQKQCKGSPYGGSQSSFAQSLDKNYDQESRNDNETMSLTEGARCKGPNISSISSQCKISSKKINQGQEGNLYVDKESSQCYLRQGDCSNAPQEPADESCTPKNDQNQMTNCNSVKARDNSYKYPCVVCDKHCPENKCSRIGNCSITTKNSKVSFSKESVKSKESYSVQNDHSSGSHESNSCHDSSLSSHRDSFSTDNPKQTLTQMKCKKSRDKSDNPCQNPCGKSFKKCKVQFNKSQKQCKRSPHGGSQSSVSQSLDDNNDQDSRNDSENMSLTEKQNRSSISSQCKVSRKKINPGQGRNPCVHKKSSQGRSSHCDIEKTKATKPHGKDPHSATDEQHCDNDMDYLKPERKYEMTCKEKHYFGSLACSSINPIHISPSCCNEQENANSVKQCDSEIDDLRSRRNPKTNPKNQNCGTQPKTKGGHIYYRSVKKQMERLTNLETKIDHCLMKPPVNNNCHQESRTCRYLVNDYLAQVKRVHCQDCISSQTKQFQNYLNNRKRTPEITKKESTRCKQRNSCLQSPLRNIEICNSQRTWNSDNNICRSAHSGNLEAGESSSSSSFSCRCSSSESIAESLSNFNMESSRCTPSPELKRAQKVHHSKTNDLFKSINQKCSAMRNTISSSAAVIKSKAARDKNKLLSSTKKSER